MMIDRIGILDKGYVELHSSESSDLKVVNAARVSFHKQKDSFVSDEEASKTGAKSDEKLLRFLATNKHWAPFAHCRETFNLHLDPMITSGDLSRLFIAGNHSGFEYSWNHDEYGEQLSITGSLFGWFKLYHSCPARLTQYLIPPIKTFFELCPYSSKALCEHFEIDIPSILNFCADSDPLVVGTTHVPQTIVHSFALDFQEHSGLKVDQISQHTNYTFKVKAPVFVRAQLYKHKMGFMESEVSRRYIKDAPEFYEPTEWRAAPTGSIKQGSGGIKYSGTLAPYQNHINAGSLIYQDLLEQGYAPEQVRGILAQSMYTEWFWTANLNAIIRMLYLRLKADAQLETQMVAQAIQKLLQENRFKEVFTGQRMASK